MKKKRICGQIRARRGKYIRKEKNLGQIRAPRGKYVRKRICGQIRSGIREEGAGEEQSATWVLQWLSH